MGGSDRGAWTQVLRNSKPGFCRSTTPSLEFDQTTNQVHVRSPIFLRWRQATWFNSNYCHTRGRRWATTTKTIVNVEDCVEGRLLMLWWEDFYLGRKILLLAGRSFFSVGKVITTRQFCPCCKVVCASCKVVLARSLQSTASHKGSNIKIVRKMSTEGIHSKRNATNLIWI